jgi:hypothetical protein
VNSFYRKVIKIMLKKITLMVGVVSTGLLVSAAKPGRDYGSFETALERRMASMMQQGFAAMDAKMGKLSSAIARMEGKVQELEECVTVMELCQPEDQLRQIKHISSLRKAVLTSREKTTMYEINRTHACAFDVRDMEEFLASSKDAVSLSLPRHLKKRVKEMGGSLGVTARERLWLLGRARDTAENHRSLKGKEIEDFLSRLEEELEEND